MFNKKYLYSLMIVCPLLLAACEGPETEPESSDTIEDSTGGDSSGAPGGGSVDEGAADSERIMFDSYGEAMLDPSADSQLKYYSISSYPAVRYFLDKDVFTFDVEAQQVTYTSDGSLSTSDSGSLVRAVKSYEQSPCEVGEFVGVSGAHLEDSYSFQTSAPYQEDRSVLFANGIRLIADERNFYAECSEMVSNLPAIVPEISKVNDQLHFDVTFVTEGGTDGETIDYSGDIYVVDKKVIKTQAGYIEAFEVEVIASSVRKNDLGAVLGSHKTTSSEWISMQFGTVKSEVVVQKYNAAGERVSKSSLQTILLSTSF